MFVKLFNKLSSKKYLSAIIAFMMIVTLVTPIIPAKAASTSTDVNPVKYYGQLQAVGNRINGSKTNQPAQVKGMSFFWSNWSDKFWNASIVDKMVDEFNCELVRATYGVQDNGTPQPGSSLDQVRRVVNQAIARGIYVIIDWHSHGAYQNVQAAKDFFSQMSKEYGQYDNVIFELYNEPVNVGWSTVKSYAEQVIPVIRANSDNLIVVGTPTWSQDVDQAANNPINDKNIAYTLHFYSGTHGQYLRDKGNYALSKGLALFVTEWGSCNADGNGGINYNETKAWLDWMDQNKISWANWAINDKAETSSIFNPGGTSLSTAGTYLKGLITDGTKNAPWRTPVIVTPTAITSGTTLEAEKYASMVGVQTETCTEGGQNVGFLDANDSLTYKVDVKTAGTYKVEYRVASLNGGGSLELQTANIPPEGISVSPLTWNLGSLSVPSTSGWQNWTTVSQEVTLSAGVQNLTIAIKTGGFNINWMKFTSTGTGTVIVDPIKVEAENYAYMSGVQLENCTEGGKNVGYIDQNDWMDYIVNIPTAGTYKVEYRVASLNGGGVISLEQNSGAKKLGTVNVPSTGGWQNWQTVTHTVTLSAGEQHIAIAAPVGGFNINWISFTLVQ